MRYILMLTALVCVQLTSLYAEEPLLEKCTPGKPGQPCAFQQFCFTDPCPTVPGVCAVDGQCVLAQ